MAGACFVSNERVIPIAQRWIGTPYQHQASCEGAGADCLGLVRGIWREIYGCEPQAVPAYTQDWSETGRVEVLLETCNRHMTAVEMALPGDLLVMRMGAFAVAKHLAILSGPATIIHAFSGHGVVQSPLSKHWARKIAGVFRFPT